MHATISDLLDPVELPRTALRSAASAAGKALTGTPFAKMPSVSGQFNSQMLFSLHTYNQKDQTVYTSYRHYR